MKYLCLILLTLFLFVSPSIVSAAAPDGLGPWADSVISSTQGLRKDGSAVAASRSNSAAAVGVAENDTVDASFFSLGFGGTITLGFINGISGGTLLIEATNNPYPSEKAKVEVSANGTTWTEAGTVTQDGEVALPESVQCAKFVRVTDVSTKADFPDDADGYDLDGVKSTGQTCEVPTPTPTPPCDASCCAKINQTNNTTVVNTVSVSQNTGKNKANLNTGGSNVIATGNASSTVSVSTTGSTNTANVKSCCGSPVNINATISNNGANSKNKIKIKNK